MDDIFRWASFHTLTMLYFNFKDFSEVKLLSGHWQLLLLWFVSDYEKVSCRRAIRPMMRESDARRAEISF